MVRHRRSTWRIDAVWTAPAPDGQTSTVADGGPSSSGDAAEPVQRTLVVLDGGPAGHLEVEGDPAGSHLTLHARTASEVVAAIRATLPGGAAPGGTT